MVPVILGTFSIPSFEIVGEEAQLRLGKDKLMQKKISWAIFFRSLGPNDTILI